LTCGWINTASPRERRSDGHRRSNGHVRHLHDHVHLRDAAVSAVSISAAGVQAQAIGRLFARDVIYSVLITEHLAPEILIQGQMPGKFAAFLSSASSTMVDEILTASGVNLAKVSRRKRRALLLKLVTSSYRAFIDECVGWAP
jgi:hypothetical protein